MGNASIFIRLLSAFTVVAVCIGAPLIYLSFDFSRSSTERRAEQSIAQQLELIASSFDQELNVNLRRSLELAANSDILAAYLNDPETERASLSRRLESLLLRIAGQHETYSAIYFADREGQIEAGIEDGRRNVRFRLTPDRPAAAEARPTRRAMAALFKTAHAAALRAEANDRSSAPARDPIVAGPFVDERGRLSLMTAVPALDFNDGAFGGVIFVRQRLDLFAERLRSVTFFDVRPAWLYASDGRVLSKPIDAQDADDPFGEFRPGFASDVRLLKVAGGIAAYRDLAILPGAPLLRIAFAIPDKHLMKDFGTTMRLFVVVLVASTALVAGFAFVVARKLSRPISELASAASRLAEGDLSARVEVDAIGEMQILVDSFNLMTANLQRADQERSEAERRLVQAMRQAESANAAKTDFLATMSHEIRTPLNGVLGTVDLLRTTAMDSRQTRYVRNIGESATGLLVILNDILDISKIEAGGIELEETDFLLRPMVVSAIDLMRGRASAKGLELTLDFAPHLPEAAVGDPTRLRQVLLNFISNAIKFTQEGRIDVQVDGRSTADGGVVLRFKIRDTGCGVAAADLETIFNKFSQADSSTTRRYGGTGLGLSISKQLAEMMGGEVGVESVLGEGSTFWFTAACRIGRPENAVDPTRESAALAADAPGPFRILVAEDHPVNQEIVRETLEDAGHDVVIVNDGREAVAVVADRPFDLVLMDIHMPEMDGPTATRAIRALAGPASQTPIVALTADAMVGDRERFLASGMNGYVSKPFKRTELFAAVARHAARRDAGRPAGGSRPPPLKLPHPAPASAADRPVGTADDSLWDAFDPNTVEPIRAGKPELWRRIAGIYLETTPESVDAIARGLAANEAAAVHLAAHTLKAASANLGALAVAETARLLEEAAEANDLKAAPELLEALRERVGRAVAALKWDVERDSAASGSGAPEPGAEGRRAR